MAYTNELKKHTVQLHIPSCSLEGLSPLHVATLFWCMCKMNSTTWQLGKSFPQEATWLESSSLTCFFLQSAYLLTLHSYFLIWSCSMMFGLMSFLGVFISIAARNGSTSRLFSLLSDYRQKYSQVFWSDGDQLTGGGASYGR